MFCVLSWADDIQYKQEELERVQQQIAKQKALLERAKKQERSTLRDIYYLNRQVSRLRQNLNYTQQRLYNTESSLNEARQALYQAQLSYDQKQMFFVSTTGNI
jgi:septal ring factor EnvC (AmiA/AmiB activator)